MTLQITVKSAKDHNMNVYKFLPCVSHSLLGRLQRVINKWELG